jgi:membrane protein YqaA with SNARE-associated domain
MLKRLHKKLQEIISSDRFKKFIFVFGFIYIFLAFFISFDPKPFLRVGYPGIFLFNLLGGPGMLLIPTFSRYFGALPVAIVSALGMAINDLLSWWVGKYAANTLVPHSKQASKTIEFLHKYGVYGLLVLALLPTPYDFVGLIAGYLKFAYTDFFLATFLGRVIRFWLIGIGAIAILGRVLS